MTTVSTIMGVFDKTRYNELKKLYKAAVLQGSSQFVEEGNMVAWHTNFAKYMIEFLDAYFKPKKQGL